MTVHFYDRSDSGPMLECAECGSLVFRDSEGVAEQTHRDWHERLAAHRHITPSDDGFENRSGGPEVRRPDRRYEAL